MSEFQGRARGRGTRGALGHRGPLIVVAVGLPLLMAVVSDRVATGIGTVDLVAYLVALLTLAASHDEWNRSARPDLAWFTVGLSVVTCHLFTTLLLGEAGDATGSRLAGELSIALVLLGIAWASTREITVTRPLIVGLAAAAGAVAVRMALFGAQPLLTTHLQALALATTVVFLATALLVWGRADQPSACRPPLTLWLLFAGVAAAGEAIGDPSTRHAVVGVAGVASVLVLTHVSAGIVTRSLRVANSAMAKLRGTVERAELDGRRDRQRLHEIDSTVAGIAAATRLLREHPDLPRSDHQLLADMVDTEVGRLERLVRDAAPEPWCVLDLDDIVQTQVISQQARGRLVSAEPSGLSAMGRADHVAEVVNILLENAARHGGGAPVSVTVRRIDDTVQVVVSDTGPGVSRSVRHSMFEWGARGPRSRGQGIGLNAASKLMADQGGYLRLLDSEEGATFAVGLRGAQQQLAAQAF